MRASGHSRVMTLARKSVSNTFVADQADQPDGPAIEETNKLLQFRLLGCRGVRERENIGDVSSPD